MKVCRKSKEIIISKKIRAQKKLSSADKTATTKMKIQKFHNQKVFIQLALQSFKAI